MKFYQYFMGVKPYMQLLALLIMSVVFLIIGSFVSALFMPLFVPIDHVDDTTSHLSESEHTGLSELLANKDALLALLNS